MKKGIRFTLLVSCVLGLATRTGANPNESIPLAGTWRFALDREDAGVRDGWFQRPLDGHIRLPGSLPGQGIGDTISTNTVWTGQIVDRSWFTAPQYAKYRVPGNVKVPFWLQPETYFVGPAWYQREVTLPAEWTGKQAILLLERPHWETRVWIDSRFVGSDLSLSTAHRYDLGSIPPGNHTLTVRVDNRMVIDVGSNSHSVSDHTQGNWNGIVGRLELSATAPQRIGNIHIYPRAESGSVRVTGTVVNSTGKNGAGNIVITIDGGGKKVSIPVAWDGNSAEFEGEIDVGPNAALWNEFSPALHTLTAELQTTGALSEKLDSRSVNFGFREISTAGNRFLINGRKTFFRGTLECAIFPKTGHPPTDIESWRRIIRVAKSHGLNLIRFHSWCPPEAAFAAADELGFYFHVEAASWANGSTTLGDGKPVDQWIYDETTRILNAYGNHPSFVLMAYGNEPGGRRHKEYLTQWTSHFKALDSRRLYTAGAGWPQIAENQFHVTPDPRIQAWGAGLKSRINALPPETVSDYRRSIQQSGVPIISHEIGQWCVYPNFDEVPKYTGYFKPKNFEIFRETLQAHHMGDLARAFLLASGKLQTLCYKEEIESALRTPGMGGFELLDIHDFPGQGTALVGVLDPFWEGKGYVTAEEFHRFCSATVPLARLAKRVFSTDETLEADLEMAHFGPAPLNAAVTSWRLVNDAGETMANGALPAIDVAVDNGIALGRLSASLRDIPAPARYKLVVIVSESRAGPTDAFENDWDIWVYPSRMEMPSPNGITITHEWNDSATAAVRAGGKVLLLLPPDQVAPDKQLGKVALGFSSIFWNTAWTHRQPPHTLGVLCDPRHPLLAQFPTDSHSNWQWWYLVSRAGAMILDDLPVDLRSTVQVIDDWVTARRLGLLFEAKVESGRLIVCSMDLENDLENNPVARQFRRSLLNYMAGDLFQPQSVVSIEQLDHLIVSPPAAN